MYDPDFRWQYEAMRSGAAAVELPGWSSITMTGSDRQRFLHNFCTNDIKRLAPGESCEAFFTDAKGRMINHGLVICREQELAVLLPPNTASRLLEHLDRYILRDDVQLRDSTENRSFILLTVARPESLQTIRDEGSYNIVAYPTWPLYNRGLAALLDVGVKALPECRAVLEGHGLVSCAYDVFEAARIEDGAPIYGIDFDDANFPQEVGRDTQAISFTKGCYLGQETVARIDALGHVNQQLVGVRFAGHEVPTAGMELLRGAAKVGRVRSAVFSPQAEAPVAIAMVRREANASGTELDSPVGACEVIQLPVTN